MLCEMSLSYQRGDSVIFTCVISQRPWPLKMSRICSARIRSPLFYLFLSDFPLLLKSADSLSATQTSETATPKKALAALNLFVFVSLLFICPSWYLSLSYVESAFKLQFFKHIQSPNASKYLFVYIILHRIILPQIETCITRSWTELSVGEESVLMTTGISAL